VSLSAFRWISALNDFTAHAYCEAAGATVEIVECDVTDAGAMRAAVEAADRARPLDLVIANAGVHPSMLPVSRGGDIIAEDRPVSDVNVMGVVNTLNPAVARMLPRGRGQPSADRSHLDAPYYISLAYFHTK
jgi:NAD(P)-dependent dehydrogenase (short-subunit alcohol dehydrogenase family)